MLDRFISSLRNNKRDWIYITIIAAITIIVYYRSINIFFWSLDDFSLIKFGRGGLAQFKHTFPEAVGGVFRPLVNLSFILFYNLFKANYVYYHIASIVMHIANCILVYCLTIKFYDDKKIAFLSGVLFSLLYTRWEAVIHIAANATLFLAFFYLLSLLSFIKYKETGSIKYYYTTLGLCIITLFTKETGVTLIVMLFLYELYYSLKNRTRFNIKFLIPLVMLWTIYLSFQGYIMLAQQYVVREKIYAFGWHFLSNYGKGIFSRLILGSLPFVYVIRRLFDSARDSVSGIIIAIAVILAIVGLKSNFISFFRKMFSSLKEHLYETIFFILFMLIYYFPLSFFLREGWAYPSRYLYGASIGFSIILGYILMEVYNFSSDKLGKPLVLILIVLIISSNLQNLYAVQRSWDYGTSRGKAEVEYLKKLDSSVKGKEIYLLDYHISLPDQDIILKLYPQVFDLKHIVFNDWDKLFTSLEEHKNPIIYKYKGNNEFEEVKIEQIEDIFEKAHKLVEDYLEEARLYPDKIVTDNNLGEIIKSRVTNYVISLGIIPPYAKFYLYRLASLSEILTLLKMRGVKIVLDGKIGDTGVISLIDIMVQSAGFEGGAYARIYLGGTNISPQSLLYSRGYNIVVLDNINGKIEDRLIFDTCSSAEASHELADFIKLIPSGRVVIAAVADEASANLTEEAVEALRSIGASQSVQGLFRYAHAVIGVKGAPSGTALEVLGDDPVGIILFGKAEERE